MTQLEPIRRIVTGHDATAKAVVLFDSVDPHVVERKETGVVSRAVWKTDGAPARMDGDADRAAGVRGIAPPGDGSIFRIVDFPSMSEAEIARLDPRLMAHQVGQDDGASRYRAPSHPFMHRTCSVDYAIVMAGEIDMLLDDGVSLHLTTGDVIVQQGTNHAWINRSGAPCRIAFVLLGAADPFA